MDEEKPSEVEIIDLSQDISDGIPQSLRKTPRKKIAVEKYSDFSFLTKKSVTKKTPTEKGSSHKKSKSGKKRPSSVSGNPIISTNTTTTTNDDGSTTTTKIVVNAVLMKTIITTTVTAPDGSESSVTVNELDIHPAKKSKSTSSGDVLAMMGGKKGLQAKTQMTETENAAFMAKQLALQESIPMLEELEKTERDRLAGMRRLKLKLEKAIEAQSKIRFPIEDTLIAQRDKKGNPPLPLPPIAQRLVNVPDSIVGDVLYVWDFLTVFSKELALKPMLVDDFVDLLRYRGCSSPALVEIFVSLLKRVHHDHSLCNSIAAAVPSHLNILSRSSEEEAKSDLLDSQKLEKFRDWDYNGMKLIPKKIHRPEVVVDALKFQCVLRSSVPRLPAYVELLRATDPQLDALISMENREGVDKDGYTEPNRDALRSLTTNYAHELQVVNEALRDLESKELHQLNLEHKLVLLMHLCRACYDTNHVRHLLAKNQEERQNQLTLMWKQNRAESMKLKAVDPELREEAMEECRAFNEAALLQKQSADAPAALTLNSKSIVPTSTKSGAKSKGKSKSSSASSSAESSVADGAKNPFDPSAPQLAAMIEDIKLRKSIGIDVVIDDNIGVSADDSHDDCLTQSLALTSRGSLAELERRRKEKEKQMIMKEDAIAWLQQALETSRERDIKDALKYGRQAELEGTLEDGRKFCTSLMFKVYRKRAQLEAAGRDARAASEHEQALTQHFVRTEPLGYDRHHRAYWCFDGDTRVFVQTTLTPDQLPLKPVNLSTLQSSSKAERLQSLSNRSDDEDEEEEDADRLVSSSAGTPLRPVPPSRITAIDNPATPLAATTASTGGILMLNGKTTSHCTLLSPPGTVSRNNAQLYSSKPSDSQHMWRIYGSMLEIWMLVEALDERGIREKELKSKLRARFGMNKGGSGESYQCSGSEYIGRKIRRMFGKKVAYGTVVGWLPPEGDDEALWHVVHDDGDEEDLDLKDITSALKKEAEVEAEQDRASQDAVGARKSARMQEADNDSDCDEEVPSVVTDYINTVAGGLGVTAKQIGLAGLKGELLRYESMLLEGLRKKGSGFQREGKRVWEHAVKSAETVEELRGCLLTLEEVIHDTQEGEDEIDSRDIKNKKEVMISDGWFFTPLAGMVTTTGGGDNESVPHTSEVEETRRQYQVLEAAVKTEEKACAECEAAMGQSGASGASKSKQGVLAKKKRGLEEAKAAFEEFKQGLSHLQQRTRRFFEGHGSSDGVIVAYLPAHLNEGVSLWHLEHDDGDTEDLDLQQVIRGQRYFVSNAQEPDEDDPDAEVEVEAEEEESDEEEAEGSGDESDVSESESDEDEDEDEGQAATDAKLWPSLNIRTRWMHAAEASTTVAEVSLALFNLMNCARTFGVVGEDPLAGSQGSRNSTKKATGQSSGSKRKRDQDHHGGASTANKKSAGSRRDRRGGGGGVGASKKSTSKKAGGGGDNSRGRSLMDRAAKRCVVNYSDE